MTTAHRTTPRSAAITLAGIGRERLRRCTTRIEDLLLPTVVGGAGGEGRVALTYDDGPTPGLTDAVADALAEAGHRATFFVLVPRAEAYPELIRTLRDRGHEVALHGLRHAQLPGQPASTAFAELRAGRSRLAALGTRPTLFRPPYGAQNRRTYLLTRAAGLRVVGWSYDPRDYREPSVGTMRTELDTGLREGAVVLQHDGQGHEPDGAMSAASRQLRLAYLDVALELLAERGLRSVTVSELIADGPRGRRWPS